MKRILVFLVVILVCAHGSWADEIIDAEWYQQANAHVKNKEHDKAIAIITKEIEKNPDNSGAYSARGTILFLFYDEREQGKKDFQKAIELNPDYYSAYTGLLMTLDGSEEEQWLLKMKEKFPEYQLSNFTLFHSHYVHNAIMLGDKDTEEGIKYIQKARELDQDYLAFLKGISEEEFLQDPSAAGLGVSGQIVSKKTIEEQIEKGLPGLDEIENDIKDGTLKKQKEINKEKIRKAYEG